MREVGGTALLTASRRGQSKHLKVSSGSGGDCPEEAPGAHREPTQGCSHSWEGAWLHPWACPLQLCHTEALRTRVSGLGCLGRCGDACAVSGAVLTHFRAV